jgi:23S rRNA (cytidine1920-2'-O)/16S rRNA (cytidine1409-2'-O)-methyltransferase
MTLTMTKRRLDQLVVDRGLAETRERAQALILAGQVSVNGQKSGKPGHSIADDARIEVAERMPYVSRGGFKLAAALDHFEIDVTGWTCLDVGASTGGFTDCLLQRGAAGVWAIDVGHGQFDWKLRNDPRVTVQEGVNARFLNAAEYPSFDLAVCDASFISVTMLIPAFAPLLKTPRRMIVLVKPQFEVGGVCARPQGGGGAGPQFCYYCESDPWNRRQPRVLTLWARLRLPALFPSPASTERPSWCEAS